MIYDDGSDQKGQAVIQRAADMDPRVRCIRGEKNMGLGYGLNQCIRQAKGRYIARMDGDDIAKPQRLEKQYAFLETHPQYQWVGSNAELIDQNGVWGFLKMPEEPKARDFLPCSPYIHPSVLFRKETLVQAGGYDPSPDFFLCRGLRIISAAALPRLIEGLISRNR